MSTVVSVSSAAGGAGQQLALTNRSEGVIISLGESSPGIEVRIGTAAWRRVTAGDGRQRFDVDLSATRVYLRKAEDAPGTVDATVDVLLGVSGLNPLQLAAALADIYGPNPSSLAVIGDSYLKNGQGSTDGVTTNLYTAQSMVSALDSLLGGAFDLVHDGAVAGSNSAEWVANQLPGVLASGARVIWVGYPTNDPLAGLTYEQTLANLTTIFAAAKNAGMVTIATTAGNRANWTATQRGQALRVSAWISAQANAAGWPVFDMLGGMYDPATGKGSTSLYLDEGGDYIHPNAAGLLFTAQRNLGNFLSKFAARPVNSMNAPTQGTYNTAMVGDTSGVPDGWSARVTGTPTTASRTKVARTDGLGALVRCTATSDAAGSTYGIFSPVINLATAWSTGAKTLGTRILGAAGDHWVCTTAGTSSGTVPAAFAAASNVGDTVTDAGGVVWTRYTTIVPGTSNIQLALDFDVHTVSGGDLGALPQLICTFGGSPVGYSTLRANNTSTANPAQRWTFTRTRRPVLRTPRVPVPPGTTTLQFLLTQQWSAASVTSTFDIYGLEVKID